MLEAKFGYNFVWVCQVKHKKCVISVKVRTVPLGGLVLAIVKVSLRIRRLQIVTTAHSAFLRRERRPNYP